MIKVWMLAFSVFSFSAFASEFNHIKLDPRFEEYLKSPGLKSRPRKTSHSLSAQKSAQVDPPVEASVIGALLGNTRLPVDGEDSPLYEEIRRHLETAHPTLGLEQVAHINRVNEQFNLGTENFSGFSWQKPFGVVQLYVDRQVTPNLFGKNWLVADSFTVEVEATTFLEKLKEAGGSFMSAAEIGAFAGLTFKRVYTYYHYADSYQLGLTADFSKLFLPFLKFNAGGMERLGHEEIMKREDEWTVSAGGLIRTPPLYNLSFSAGILAESALTRRVSLESRHSDDVTAQRYRVGVMSKKTSRTGVTMELQFEFFRLLQLSILRSDLNYEFSASKEVFLGLSQKDWEHVKADPEEGQEFHRLLRGQGTVALLEPYVVGLEENSSRALESRGSILIFGKISKSKTEQKRIIKDRLVKVFYKNYNQSVKVVQNFLSRLFSAVVYKLLKIPMGASHAAVYSRELTLEYEATHPQATDPKVVRIDSSEQFSFVMTQSYSADSTDRWIDKKYRTGVINFVDLYTLLPKDYMAIIRSEQLKGPLVVESNVRVEKTGFNHLLAADENVVFGQFAKVCGFSKSEDWTGEKKRAQMLREDQDGKDACVKDIGLKFLSFKKDYHANLLKPSLAKFKIFMDKYFKQTKNIRDLAQLFGTNNTFIHGSLSATRPSGDEFNTTFSSGDFRGLGVIDNFKRSGPERGPASITGE